MKKLFNFKFRFENSTIYIFSILTLIYSLLQVVNKNYEGVRIINNNIVGIIFIVLSGCIIFFESLLITVFKAKDFNLIKRILFYLSCLLIVLVVVDFLVLGLVRSFIIADGLSKKVYKSYPLNVRLAYIFNNNYTVILKGVWTTIWLSLAGTIVGLILGLIFVSLRTLEVTPQDCEFVALLKKIGSGFVKCYVTVFRGTPMMVQAIIIYYFLPVILANIFNVNQDILNDILSVSVAGFITVSLNTTAYLTEVLRGGIEALNGGQMEAARSLGMSRTKAMLFVVLPQGIKNSLPAICNEFIINIKDTSVLSVIQVMDLFFVIDLINGKLSNQDSIFIAAIIYLILTYSISKLLGFIEKKMNLVAKPLPSSN